MRDESAEVGGVIEILARGDRRVHCLRYLAQTGVIPAPRRFLRPEDFVVALKIADMLNRLFGRPILV